MLDSFRKSYAISLLSAIFFCAFQVFACLLHPLMHSDLRHYADPAQGIYFEFDAVSADLSAHVEECMLCQYFNFNSSEVPEPSPYVHVFFGAEGKKASDFIFQANPQIIGSSPRAPPVPFC